MSSIYKKGRDGYYYYQAYIYNPQTGKKDKRIFHSLGTKDGTIAKEKQIFFDNQYGNDKKNQKEKYIILFAKKYYKVGFVIISFSIGIFLMLKTSFSGNQTLSETKTLPNKKERNDIGIQDNAISNFSDSSAKKLHNNNYNTFVSDPSPIEKPKLEPIIIPKYSIVRLERQSGPFDQGKIFATVDTIASKESLRLLCDSLTKRFDEYAYIVICLYSNTQDGYDMAMGNDRGMSTQNKKNAWLAMFSANPVEGVMFNDNPGGYLGAY